MPSALSARAKPFAALTFIAVSSRCSRCRPSRGWGPAGRGAFLTYPRCRPSRGWDAAGRGAFLNVRDSVPCRTAPTRAVSRISPAPAGDGTVHPNRRRHGDRETDRIRRGERRSARGVRRHHGHAEGRPRQQLLEGAGEPPADLAPHVGDAQVGDGAGRARPADQGDALPRGERDERLQLLHRLSHGVGPGTRHDRGDAGGADGRRRHGQRDEQPGRRLPDRGRRDVPVPGIAHPARVVSFPAPESEFLSARRETAMNARRPLPTLILIVTLALLLAYVPTAAEAQAPAGQMTWAVHISLAPVWFDPAEHTGIISVMMVLTAVHDAMVKPMPGKPFAPSLAESWTVSKDGLVYEFVVRKGVLFFFDDTVTAEDVKFSFERYKGAAASLLKEKVAAVEVVDPYRVRFRLKEPWPDFMTFYGSPASGAGWIVPKKYVEKVGDEGFKKAPIGAGPYKLTSFNPGIELVLDAHDRYWRKTPAVKRLVWKTVTEDLTRLAMLKRGEVDIAYSLRGPLGEEVKKTPGLKLVGLVGNATQWLNFGAPQWDPKSPWHDKRVRLAAALAFDKDGIKIGRAHV